MHSSDDAWHTDQTQFNVAGMAIIKFYKLNNTKKSLK